ncbi:hypothetical protein ACSW9O_15335 (plasmid) [Clostridium perfringens]
MKISDLINELKTIEKLYGNLEVVRLDSEEDRHYLMKYSDLIPINIENREAKEKSHLVIL